MLGPSALKALKAQVRVDYDDDDRQLLRLLDTAEEMVVAMTQRPKSELQDPVTGRYPAPLFQAMVIVAGHMYDEPGAMVSANVKDNPYGVSFLIRPWQKLTD